MAIFKSKEEKELQQKEKVEKFVNRYSLGEIDERDMENLLEIASKKSSLNFLDTGNFLAGNEKDFLQQIAWQQDLIFDQNLLIIKQLDRLNKNLEKLIKY